MAEAMPFQNVMLARLTPYQLKASIFGAAEALLFQNRLPYPKTARMKSASIP